MFSQRVLPGPRDQFQFPGPGKHPGKGFGKRGPAETETVKRAKTGHSLKGQRPDVGGVGVWNTARSPD